MPLHHIPDWGYADKIGRCPVQDLPGPSPHDPMPVVTRRCYYCGREWITTTEGQQKCDCGRPAAIQSTRY